MKFKSTRGGESGLSFEEAVMKGLADDGGLFVPEQTPKLNLNDFLQLLTENEGSLNFQEVFFKVAKQFIENEIPENDLKTLISKSFSTFRVNNVVNIARPCDDLFVLELFHGPTYSFKDVALQFLGNLFEYFLVRAANSSSEKNSSDSKFKKPTFLTILGATSGDTGSAAIHGLRGKNKIEVFILHPHGRVSPIQNQQMTTVLDNNVHNVAIQGTFDDCQAIVKTVFNDIDFKRKYSLGAINSINLARIISQLSYYVYTYLYIIHNNNKNNNNNIIKEDNLEKIVFCVPTGNFGDILAGFYAKNMGLPIERLICATNINNILHHFFTEGKYHKNKEVHATFSPSMDIQVASNFERFLLYLANDDHQLLKSWMTEFEKNGCLTVNDELLKKANNEIISYDVDEKRTLEVIKLSYTNWNYPICPHTAVGIGAALKLKSENKDNLSKYKIVCLATAHHAKFGDAVAQALGHKLPLPEELQKLDNLPKKVELFENNSEVVKNFVKNCLDKKQNQ